MIKRVLKMQNIHREKNSEDYKMSLFDAVELKQKRHSEEKALAKYVSPLLHRHEE
jgi:hypothetical protein